MSATMYFPDSRCSEARARRSVVDLDVLHRFATAEDDVVLAHLMDQLVHDLVIEELERPRPLVDDRHLYAERGEHRGVLDADDAGTRRPPSCGAAAADRGRYPDVVIVSLVASQRPMGLLGRRADCDQNVSEVSRRRPWSPLDDEGVRIVECAPPVHQPMSLRARSSSTVAISRSMTRATCPTSCDIVGRTRSGQGHQRLRVRVASTRASRLRGRSSTGSCRSRCRCRRPRAVFR